ncbi:MAG TPA: hypothetical protein VGE24_02770 [Emticicia sp.]
MAKIFYKAIIFCSNPLRGVFKFEDVFQIYPIQSANAPQSNRVKMYPAIIEYHVEDNIEIAVPDFLGDLKDYAVKQTVTQNYQRRLRNLLSAITNYWFYFPRQEVKWFVDLPEGELDSKQMNAQCSKAGISTYWYPQLLEESRITAFTDTSHIRPAPLVKHPECFMNIDLEGEEEIRFPDHTIEAINNYFALNTAGLDAVDSATSLICNGINLMNEMKSISFISFISSIETMVNYEFKGVRIESCEACGQPRYKVVRKFRDYLEKYVSDSTSAKKQFREIYGLRSQIAHTGMLLLGDGIIDWSEETGTGQRALHLNAMQTSRLSLTNWLLRREEEQQMGQADT